MVTKKRNLLQLIAVKGFSKDRPTPWKRGASGIRSEEVKMAQGPLYPPKRTVTPELTYSLSAAAGFPQPPLPRWWSTLVSTQHAFSSSIYQHLTKQTLPFLILEGQGKDNGIAGVEFRVQSVSAVTLSQRSFLRKRVDTKIY